MSTVREGWNRYATAWASRYGGYDLRRAPAAVRRWQRLAYRVARVTAAVRVPAVALTVVVFGLAGAVPVLAARGGTWLVLAAGLVVLATLAGTVEAAMAVLGPRSSRTAAIRESVVSLLAEIAWLVAFWLVGVAGPLVVACGVLSGLHEYVRVHALGAGMSRLAAQTAGDRPVRLLLVVVGLSLAGLVGDELAAGLLTVISAVWLALAVLGLTQLVGAVRRSLG
jgi:CDP-diacylglycerol--glycerol-3-phosphate 3-phosphatidyltransferase